jgi:hypothetical protein
MGAAMMELLPLAIAAFGGVCAGFWPGWTAAMWHAGRDRLAPFGQLDGEEDHDAAWEAQFSAAPVVLAPRGRHAGSAMERWASEPRQPAHGAWRAHDHRPGASCWCGAWPALRVVQAAALVPLPAPAADDEDTMAPPRELAERAATYPEIAASAEYQLTWGEVYSLMDSASDWYDRTFQTGQFPKVEP